VSLPSHASRSTQQRPTRSPHCLARYPTPWTLCVPRLPFCCLLFSPWRRCVWHCARSMGCPRYLQESKMTFTLLACVSWKLASPSVRCACLGDNHFPVLHGCISSRGRATCWCNRRGGQPRAGGAPPQVEGIRGDEPRFVTLHTPHCYQCESVVTQRLRLTACSTRRRLGGVASCSGQSIPRATSSPCEANGGYATATWPPGGASSKAPGHW